MKSLINRTEKDIYLDEEQTTPLQPCPDTSSLDLVASLLISTVDSLTGVGVPSLETKLTHLGINSFDIVRIANQIEIDHSQRFGSHDCHMPQLLEKLFECDITGVSGYIIGTMSSWGFQDSKDKDAIHNSRKRSSMSEPDTTSSSKKYRDSSASQKTIDLSHDGHVSTSEHHMSPSIVESWIRGKHFINGR